MKDIMKIVKSLKKSGFLIKEIIETITNEANKQKGVFLPILLGTLAANILGNALIGKGVIKTGKAVLKASQNF